MWLAALATAVVALAKLLLMRLQTPTVLSLLAGRARAHVRPGFDADMAARCVAWAARRLRADCLPQAVALAALLQRGGATPTVVLGCRLYGPSSWGAHAWVELDGRRFDTMVDAEHAELGRLTAAEGWKVRAGA